MTEHRNKAFKDATTSLNQTTAKLLDLAKDVLSPTETNEFIGQMEDVLLSYLEEESLYSVNDLALADIRNLIETDMQETSDEPVPLRVTEQSFDGMIAKQIKNSSTRKTNPKNYDAYKEFCQNFKSAALQGHTSNDDQQELSQDPLEEASFVLTQDFRPPLDPIVQIPIRTPVRNRVCRHVYEAQSINQMLKNFNRKKNMRCPYVGCTNKNVQKTDLEIDLELQEKIASYEKNNSLGDGILHQTLEDTF